MCGTAQKNGEEIEITLVVQINENTPAATSNILTEHSFSSSSGLSSK